MVSTEDDIRRALFSNPVDIVLLSEISRKKNGFISNRIRSRVWPKLLGINRFDIVDFKYLIKNYRDKDQLRKDVERSLWSLDTCKDWSDSFLMRKRNSLQEIISALFCKFPLMYYFQGFHDIVSVVMLVVNDDCLTYAIVEAMATNFFVDYMGQDFEILPTIMKLINFLIEIADAELFAFLSASGTEPFYATSWLITWLSHDVKDLDLIARIFDVMLSSHPLYCLYISAAIVLHHKALVLQQECEFSSVHHFLARVPQTLGVDMDQLLLVADDLFARVPPSKLLQLANGGADITVDKRIKLKQLHFFSDRATANTPSEIGTRPWPPSDLVLLHNNYLRNLPTLHRITKASSASVARKGDTNDNDTGLCIGGWGGGIPLQYLQYVPSDGEVAEDRGTYRHVGGPRLFHSRLAPHVCTGVVTRGMRAGATSKGADVNGGEGVLSSIRAGVGSMVTAMYCTIDGCLLANQDTPLLRYALVFSLSLGAIGLFYGESDSMEGLE